MAALKLHHLRPAPGAKTDKVRVGRGEGGKRGKTAGRGTKGSGAGRFPVETHAVTPPVGRGQLLGAQGRWPNGMAFSRVNVTLDGVPSHRPTSYSTERSR